MEEKIELKKLNINLGRDEYNMLQNIKNNENGFSNPAYMLSYDEYKEWLKEEDKHSRGENLPDG